VVETAEQVRERTSRRWFPWVAIAVLGTLVLFPPFRPPVPWRWVTNRVPWQVVDRVPWAPPTETVSVAAYVCGSLAIWPGHFNQHYPGGGVHLEAFGRYWGGSQSTGGAGPEAGSFHLVDVDHGVFTVFGDGETIRVAREARSQQFCYA
jgi:hypothetical protein